ncbi:MAG: hypothetical protein KIT09_04070 [Bryobacteraceae bacterium]|nr:hypothetical protein [Bryobacteraceae bacterium]
MGTRKELFTLLGVAAAVAVLSTGLFYGLVVNRLQESAETAEAQAERPGDALGIPSGMRAVSVHVVDSSGVVRLLRPGHRVDVQMVYSLAGNPPGTALRTVAQNLEVFRSDDGAPGERPSAPVVTLLARPDEADALGLADTAARIRLLLRHPKDAEISERKSLELTALTAARPDEKPAAAARR